MDELRRIERRDADWAKAEWGDDGFRQHPETECQADRDRHTLLAALAVRTVAEPSEPCLFPGCVLPRKPYHDMHEPAGVPPLTPRNLFRRLFPGVGGDTDTQPDETVDTDYRPVRSEPGAEGLTERIRESLDANNVWEWTDDVSGVQTGFDGNKDALAEAIANDLAATPAADSRGLDVERLARAMHKVKCRVDDPRHVYEFDAPEVAREYAALTDPEPAP